jgi:emp24/gp25L/p24 family/GOLD
LEPIEVELRRIENIVGEIVTDLEYLKAREQRMRDTNESTNDRVKNFAILTSFPTLENGINDRSYITWVDDMADYLSSNLFSTERHAGVIGLAGVMAVLEYCIPDFS